MTCKICIAGFGQKISVWLTLTDGKVTGCIIEEPRRREHVEDDSWLADHFIIVPIKRKYGPKATTKVCQFLALQAGRHAVRGVRDYSIAALATGLTAQYGYQIANGAKILPEHGEIAKVHSGDFAVYFYETRCDKEDAAAKIKAKLRPQVSRNSV